MTGRVQTSFAGQRIARIDAADDTELAARDAGDDQTLTTIGAAESRVAVL